MSLLALSPSLSSLAHVLSASADGRVALVIRSGLIYLTAAGRSRSLMLAADVVATAVVDSAAWLVTADADGHTLHRFSHDGRPLGPAIFLGELGEDITVTASPMAASAAAPLVVIEGRRGVLVRALGEDVEVEELERAQPVRRQRAVTVEESILEGSILEGSILEGSILEGAILEGSIGEETGQVSLGALEAAIEAQATELFAALALDVERAGAEERVQRAAATRSDSRARLESVGGCQ